MKTIDLNSKWAKALLFIFILFNPPLFAQHEKSTEFIIDTHEQAQTIDNIGASGCWFSEGIGKYWPAEKKEQIAEWLFSREFDASGNPKGIGLSAWRFNIGGGTAEQGDSSGIKDFRKRVECFQRPDGTYDWSKQSGYLWFVRKAKEYGVENLIAFANTPPVQFTKNGRGFKTVRDFQSNLKSDKYNDYTRFLTDVLQHFEQQGLHFNYISPVNEPQWDWSNKPGQASQEGSPWHNQDIYQVVKLLDSNLSKAGLDTKIMLTEAGTLDYLFRNEGKNAKQIQHFFSKDSVLYLSALPHMPKFIGGHSYFTDNGDTNRVKVREMLSDTVKKYNIDFWQTEYSMLGDGYKEGLKAKRTAMDCALFLSKIIHTDLTVANAAAWHLWNSYEPGDSEAEARYYLIALKPNLTHTDGEFYQTKALWAMGNYSRFIRPGMHRIMTSRSDQLDDVAASQNIMFSAFCSDKQVVAVAINYTTEQKEIKLTLKNFGKIRHIDRFITSSTSGDDLKRYTQEDLAKDIILPPRSITTFVMDKY